jgi:hypothetical protein
LTHERLDLYSRERDKILKAVGHAIKK